MKRPTMLSEVRRAREMRANRATYAEIMAAMGRSANWVTAHTRDVDGARRRTTPNFTANRDRARDLYRNGMPRAKIAKVLGVHRRTVSEWCGGLKVDPKLKMPARALAARERGLDNDQIARLVGYKSAKIVATVISQERRRQEMCR